VAVGQTPNAGDGSGSALEIPKFAAISIRQNNSDTTTFGVANTPDGVTVKNATLLMLIRRAYGMFTSLDDKFVGMPNWAKSDRYDIEAKVDPADVYMFRKLTQEQRSLAIQNLVADRFRLRVHQEKREQAIYALAVGKNGPKLTDAKPGDTYSKGITDEMGHTGAGVVRQSSRLVQAQAAPLSVLAVILTQVVGRTVEDRTGLLGKYDFTLRWTPETAAATPPGPQELELPNDSGPSIFTALQEQLGLKLEPTKGPVEVLVVDHVERPSEN
jgi:uncharacterized protein (TIGR03435 family)